MSKVAILKLVGWLCVANFLVFIAVAVLLGGDAVNGKIEGGHYFLAQHGKLTEVSAGVFAYSRLHVYSLIVTHPLAAICLSTAAKMGKGQST